MTTAVYFQAPIGGGLHLVCRDAVIAVTEADDIYIDSAYKRDQQQRGELIAGPTCLIYPASGEGGTLHVHGSISQVCEKLGWVLPEPPLTQP